VLAIGPSWPIGVAGKGMCGSRVRDRWRPGICGGEIGGPSCSSRLRPTRDDRARAFTSRPAGAVARHRPGRRWSQGVPHSAGRGLSWTWSDAPRCGLCTLPAAFIVLTGDPSRGLAWAVGIVPAAIIGLASPRSARRGSGWCTSGCSSLCPSSWGPSWCRHRPRRVGAGCGPLRDAPDGGDARAAKRRPARVGPPGWSRRHRLPAPHPLVGAQPALGRTGDRWRGRHQRQPVVRDAVLH
jgi:hypothetical protein